MTSPVRAVTCCIAAVLWVGACSGDDDSTPAARVVQPGAPGETSRVLQPDEVPDVAEPQHTDADVAFVHAMIEHHAQALRMTALVAGRTSRDDIPLFAERIELSQEDEIAWMIAWLEARAEAHHGAGHDEHGTHGDSDAHELMPGMLTEEQFAALEAASGDEFDRLFLELMYLHHRGALETVQQLLDSGDGQQPELWRFVNHIDSDQRIEMGRIEMLLGEMETSR